MGAEPQRILVYRCGTLGDTLVALPAIRALRRRYPGARFLYMTASDRDGKVWADEVLREFGWFDAFVTYRSAEIRDPVSLWRVAARVRRHRPDLAVLLASDKNGRARLWRDRLFFALAGVSRCIAVPSPKARWYGGLRRSPRVYPLEVDRLLAGVVAATGVEAAPVEFALPVRAEHEVEVLRLIAAAGLDCRRPLVALCPGSKQPIKCWPVDRYAAVGERLINDGGVNLAVVGGPDEAGVGARIGGAWPARRWINLASRLSILQSAALLQQASFYVGNDTGAMHLAAAVGTRCVAVFSAREPARSWFPWGDQHIVMRRNVSCQNCYLDVCVAENLRCLNDITVDEVWSACRRMLVYENGCPRTLREAGSVPGAETDRNATCAGLPAF